MSLNKGNMDLGTGKISHSDPSPLATIVQTIHKTKTGSICMQCLTAPAFETRRRAVKSARLSIEATKGNAQARSIISQIR